MAHPETHMQMSYDWYNVEGTLNKFFYTEFYSRLLRFLKASELKTENILYICIVFCDYQQYFYLPNARMTSERNSSLLCLKSDVYANQSPDARRLLVRLFNYLHRYTKHGNAQWHHIKSRLVLFLRDKQVLVQNVHQLQCKSKIHCSL